MKRTDDSSRIAIVGIGSTDYRADYALARAGKPGTDLTGYAVRAFRDALQDSGLVRADIDGLVTATLPYERMGELLGMNPRWSSPGTDPAASFMLAADAIRAGRAECVALIKALDFKSMGTRFGGPQAMGAEQLLHYAYYRPWGFTSQGAFDAVVVQRYMELYGLTHRDMGDVPVAQRAWARLNPRAIMQAPMTIEDYLAHPFIVAPLRLPDYCVIADGAVALIMTTLERARKMARHPLVTIMGMGWGEDNMDVSQLRSKLAFNRMQVSLAARQSYEEAGYGPEDMNGFYFYDNFSGELFYTLENCGYCAEGEGVSFVKSRGIGPGGSFPVNTSGGMMSEAYMQGWNAQVEMVRQLRGQAGTRQIIDCRRVHYVSNTIGKASSIIYARLP